MDEHTEWLHAAENIEARARADTVKGMVARSELIHHLTKLPHRSAHCQGCIQLKQRFCWVLPSDVTRKSEEEIVPSCVPVSTIKKSFGGKSQAAASSDENLAAPSYSKGGASWKHKVHSKGKGATGAAVRQAAKVSVQLDVVKGEWLWSLPKPAGQPAPTVLPQQSTALADYMAGMTVPLWRDMPLEKAQCHGVCVFDGHKLYKLAKQTADGESPELWSESDLAPLAYYIDHVWRRAQEEGQLLSFVPAGGSKQNELPFALLFHTGLEDCNTHEAIFCVLRKVVQATDARVQLAAWVKSTELHDEAAMNRLCGLSAPASPMAPQPPCFFDEYLTSDGSLVKPLAAEFVLNKRLSLTPDVPHLVSLKGRLPAEDSIKSNAQLTVELSRSVAVAHERVLVNPRDAIPVFWRDHNQIGSKGHIALLFPGSFTTADPARAPARFAYVVSLRKDAMQPSGLTYHVDSLVTAAVALRAARVTGKLQGWLLEALHALTE